MVKTVSNVEKKNVSPKVVDAIEKLSPLREPSPFDLEFEDMLATQMISVEEGELFDGIQKVKEAVIDTSKIDDSVGVVTGVAMDETNEEIQEIEQIEEMNLEEGDNVVELLDTREVFENEDIDQEKCEIAVTPAEESKEMEGNRVVVAVEVHKEDVWEVETEDDKRNAIIEGNHPTPSYLPPRITIPEKPYGKLYEYRHFEIPTIKMDEDPRNILLAPSSNYSDTEEGRLLKRLHEKARRKGCEVTNVPDGY